MVEEKPENVTLVTNTTNEDDPEEPPTYGELTNLQKVVGLLNNFETDTDTLNFFPNYYSREGPRRGLRVRRETQNKTTTPPTSMKPVVYSTINHDNDSKDNPNDPARCVVQCIMAAYSMVHSLWFCFVNKFITFFCL